MPGFPARSLLLAVALTACGPVPMPEGGFRAAPDLLDEMSRLRGRVRTLRAAGRVDHFGEEHRVQGRAFVFLELPCRLRIDVVSPFGSALSVLTVDGDEFSLADHRSQRFFVGPADPCNIARLVQVPLPPEEAVRMLIGDVPVIPGGQEIRWLREGRYRVTVRDGPREQTLDVDPDSGTLALRRSRLTDAAGVVFDVRYDRWRQVGEAFVPHEIRLTMPREKADVLLRYDDGEVEVNAELPAEAWRQEFPPGAAIETVFCP
ncbi:MAG TPA: DUF4292 domain-containing protein [Polyangia bacterium]|nr:DUF4292 domain-containing protein [Polyangia bacterium]